MHRVKHRCGSKQGPEFKCTTPTPTPTAGGADRFFVERIYFIASPPLSSVGAAPGSLFLSQAVIGILGNFSLLRHYLSLYHSRCRMRDTDLILMHLTLANFFLILSKAVPNTMIALGWKHFISDLGCQVIFYVYRITKGVSIGTTCLLSVYQTIMISPMNSCWKELKVRAPKYVGCSISLCWILHILVNFIFPTYVSYISSQWSNQDTMNKTDWQDCFSVDHQTILGTVYTTLLVFPEVLFSVLIIWSSGSMVFIL
ncbi:vomeronasal type-1 receptor 4-like [Erinaceus europaeus]|uniref:Vomeronasal type-1 receptor n=1 Tax=Erinaceus europaeus TaxID=9365 RepID=A0A1S3AP21_ERIEU|nr:vomeronasal type-1 receptor 4-like [Erinaceus europaeus]